MWEILRLWLKSINLVKKLSDLFVKWEAPAALAHPRCINAHNFLGLTLDNLQSVADVLHTALHKVF